LKEKYRGREDEEKDVNNYWMTLGKKRRCWKLKEEAINGNLWVTCFGGFYGPVVRQNMLL
jgi:hypothetical protein